MFWQQLFAKKTLEQLAAEAKGENRLRRVLGPIGLTSLGVGAIIGAGIFVMTGRAAAQDAGPAIIISYCVAGLGCLFAALCYAEFASAAPVAGSAYTYAYATLGELFAWFIGWDLILEYAMACACVASSWSKYLNEFLNPFGVHVPAQISYDPFTLAEKGYGGIIPGANLMAVLIIVACTIVLVIGIRESATTNAILVGVKLGVVLFVIGVGLFYVSQSNWTGVPPSERLHAESATEKWGILGYVGLDRFLLPIDNSVRTNFTPYGLSGIMLGAAIVFFAYIGFDSISTHSEEAKRPHRDVPLAILASLILCTLLYIGVAAVITGMVPYPKIDPNAAVASAFREKGEATDSALLRWSGFLIATGALAGMTSVLLITFLSQARIFLAMARDGLLPPGIFGAIHERFRTPHLSTMLTGGLIAVVAAFTPITKLEEMVNIGTLAAFVIVCAAVLVLRIKRPDAPRPFRTPLVYLVAPAGILVNLIMMLFLPLDTWLRLVGWLVVGLCLYFGYGFWNSTIGKMMRFGPAFARAEAALGRAPAVAGNGEAAIKAKEEGVTE
ncbi:MAG TPA: amino acid permease [Gemmataceae bacterium]|nr:amino acid permease [Gemmataceae bacterium]